MRNRRRNVHVALLATVIVVLVLVVSAGPGYSDIHYVCPWCETVVKSVPSEEQKMEVIVCSNPMCKKAKAIYDKHPGWSMEIAKYAATHPRVSVKVLDKVSKGTVWVGMTKELAELSWGRPHRTTRTVNKNGSTEIWHYDEDYLVFQNGKLISATVSH